MESSNTMTTSSNTKIETNLKLTAIRRLIDYTLMNVYKKIETIGNTKEILENLSKEYKPKLLVKKDFVAKTKNGEIIKIPKGSILTEQDLVEFEVMIFNIISNKNSETRKITGTNLAVNELASLGIIQVFDVVKFLKKNRLNGWRIIEKNGEKILIICKFFGRTDKKALFKFYDPLIYLTDIAKYLNITKIIVLVNSQIGKSVFRVVNFFKEKHGLNISIIHVNDWLKKYWEITKEAISSVHIWKENNKWRYGIEVASSPNGPSPFITIYLYEEGEKPNKNLKIV